MRRQEIAELVRDIFVFIIYTFLLFILILGERDSVMVVSHDAMVDIVVKAYFAPDGIPTDSVRNLDDIYDYINNTIIGSLHPQRWYENWDMVDPGVIKDFSTRLLGIVQLRQLRIDPHTCTIPPEMRFMNLSCESEWSQKMKGCFLKKYSGRLKDIWFWKSSEETGSDSLTANMFTYPGEGFVAYLGRTKFNSEYNLRYLKNHKWLDYYTRVVIIEFWTYNANYNVFHAVTILFERSASGWILPYTEIHTQRLIIANISKWYFVIFLGAIFVLLNIRQLVRLAKGMIKLRWKFYTNMWNFVDFILIAFCLTCLGYHYYDFYLAQKLLQKLDDAKHNQFVPFRPTFAHNKIYNRMVAFLVALIVLRLWKFLRFAIIFQVMERTLFDCLVPMFFQFIRHGIVVMMFGQVAILLYGPYSELFHSIPSAITNLLLMSINLQQHMDWETIMHTHYLVGYLYYFFYMLTSITFVNIYIVILIFAHHKNIQTHTMKEVYGVKQYVMDESRYYLASFKAKLLDMRLRGGADNEQTRKQKLCYSKEDPLRYADSEAIPEEKLNLMRLVAKAIAKNTLRNAESHTVLQEMDYELMRDIAVCVIKQYISKLTKAKSKEKGLFYRSVTKNRGATEIKFVSDDRLQDMAFVVNRILVHRDDPKTEPVAKVSLMHQLRVIQAQIDDINKVLENIVFREGSSSS